MTLARGSTSCSCSTVFPVCVGSPARRRAHVCHGELSWSLPGLGAVGSWQAGVTE